MKTAQLRKSSTLTLPALLILSALTGLASISTVVNGEECCFNAVRNPSFENGLNPNDPYPLDWGNWTKHGTPEYSITVDDSTAVDLFHSAKLDIGLPAPGQTIGFIALTQHLPPNTLFRNLTDRPDGIDVWFKLQPKFDGMGDFRVRILHGENLGELNYVFDRDVLLDYPNSSTVDGAGRPTGVKSIFIPTSSLPSQGSWFHFTRNLRADWQAPLLIRQPDGTTVTAPGFSLDIPFQTMQFDALFFTNSAEQFFAETAWVDDVKLWLDIPPPTPPLTVNFNFSPASPTLGSPVSFTGSGSGGTAPYSFSWNFGDDTSPSYGNPTSHVYSTTGDFAVTLTVTDSNLVTSTITRAITVLPPRYSLIFNFTDLRGAIVDSYVTWRLFNATDQAVIGYRLGDRTLPAGWYTLEAYYPTYLNQNPDRYRILSEQIALSSDISRVFPLAMVPQDLPGSYIAFDIAVTTAYFVFQNSTVLIFNATEAPSSSEYVILAKTRFLPVSVLVAGSQRTELTNWSYDQANSIVRITTFELGRFTIASSPSPRIPMISLIDRAGESPTNIVILRIVNSKGDTIALELQGQVTPDENFPYYVEAHYRGYVVYRSVLAFSTANPVQHQTIELQMIQVGELENNHIAISTSINSISVTEHSNSRIAFTIVGTGSGRIVVDVPKRPLYVERNGMRTASWEYNSQTSAISVDGDIQGNFLIVLENPRNYLGFAPVGGIVAAIALAALLASRRKSGKRKPPK